jgi:hypothetical protein
MRRGGGSGCRGHKLLGAGWRRCQRGEDPDNCNCKGEGAGDEAKTIAAINVRRINNGAGDPVANKYGYDGNGDGDGDGNGIAMLANGTEVSRRNVDATSKQGDVRWMPLHRVIVVLLNSNITLSQYIINLCTIVINLNMF